LDDDPSVAGEEARDLALVAFRQEFHAHSGIITNVLFGSGYAGLGPKFRALKWVNPHWVNEVPEVWLSKGSH